MSIVRIFALLLCLGFSQANVFGESDLRWQKSVNAIKYVRILHMDESRFKTIGEYFGDRKERQYFRCVARDSPNGRTGTYFIVGLNGSVVELPVDISAKISIITSPIGNTHVFECKIPEGNRFPLVSEIYCGLVSEKIDISQIKAWKVEFVDGSGSVLFSKCSYMWR